MRSILKILQIIFIPLSVVLMGYGLYHFHRDIPLEKLKPIYANQASRFWDWKGIPVHYRDEGPREDSLPLVLIHGTAASLHTWDSVAQLWSASHRVIRMDLPGFGLTGPAPDMPSDMDMYNAFLEDLLKQLGVQRCVLVGNSLGGYVSWHYAAVHPDQVTRMLLVSPAGFDSVMNATPSKNPGFRLMRVRWIQPLLRWVTPEPLIRKSVEQVYGDAGKVTDELTNRYMDLLLREGNRQALIRRLSKKAENRTAELQEITIPVLIYWGEKDNLIPIDYAVRFQERLPIDSLIRAPGLGHVPMEEDATRFVRDVNPFIRNKHVIPSGEELQYLMSQSQQVFQLIMGLSR